jgi:hypothetical protein
MDEKIAQLEREITQLKKQVNDLVYSDRYVMEKALQLFDGRNIIIGRTTGTMIGTATDQKLAFFGGTPVDRPATVTDPSGGTTIDSEARVAISSLIDRLQEVNLIA